jgi:hypothetical protein
MTHLPKAVVPSKVRMLPILKMAYFQYSSKSQRSVQKICAWTRTGNVFGQWRMLLMYNRIGGMTQAHLENGHRAQDLLEIDLLKTRQRDLNAVVSIAIGFGLDLRIGS